MAHYAFLDSDNRVVEVIAGRDEDDLVPGVTSWEDYYGHRRGRRCKRTSYNTRANEHTDGGTPFRGNYAGIGFTYDEARDAFIAPQPFPSWTLNEQTFSWDPPVPEPDEPGYEWDESAQNWVLETGE